MPCLEKHLKSLAFIALCSVWALSLPSEGSENKLTDLLNRAAITDILTQYSYRWDSKDSAGFADLFTDDGVLERWVNGKKVDTATIDGKDAILEYAKNSHRGRLSDRLSRHHFSGIVFIELKENSAITKNMALITHQTKDDSTAFISSSGYYLNTWRKTEEGWRISKRILEVDTLKR